MERERAEDSPRFSATITLVVVLLASIAPFLQPLIHGEIFSFRDHTDYFVPLRLFTAERMSQGELPLWNPFNGSGERWLANPQTGVFYPPSWIFLILPFATAYVTYLWLHVAILGAGAFVLLRRWCSPQAAMVGAIALMLCGPVMSMLDVSNNLGTFAWFPAVIAVALERASQAPRLPRAAAVVVIVLMFLGGEPFLALVGAALYSVAYLAEARNRWRIRILELCLIGLLSIMLSGAQLVPFVELMRGSDRLSSQRTASLRESIAPRDWLATLIPTPATHAPAAAELSQRYIPSIYLGVPMVFAAAVAAIRARQLDRPRQRAAAGWLVVLFFTILFAAGKWIPLTAYLWAGLGFDLSRYPARLVPVGALAVVALAAIGFDQLGTLSLRHRLAILAGFLTVAALASLLFTTPGARGWQLGMLMVWLFVLLFLLLRPARATVPLVLMIALLIGDLLIAAQPLLQAGPFQRNLEPYRSALTPPFKLVRLFEYATPPLTAEDRRAWLSGYSNLLIGVFDASTPAPVVPAAYLEIHDRAVTGPRLDIVDFLSIGFLATTRAIAHGGFVPVARNAKVTLFRNRTALPTAQLWGSIQETGSSSDAVRQLLGGAMDARSTLLVSCRDNEECRIPRLSSGGGPMGLASVRFQGLNRVVVEAEASGPAVLVLTQLDAPGWSAKLDGTPGTILRAQGLFRAIAIPEGRHQVTWSYLPVSLMAGMALSVIALALITGELVTLRSPKNQIGMKSPSSFVPFSKKVKTSRREKFFL